MGNDISIRTTENSSKSLSSSSSSSEDESHDDHSESTNKVRNETTIEESTVKELTSFTTEAKEVITSLFRSEGTKGSEGTKEFNSEGSSMQAVTEDGVFVKPSKKPFFIWSPKVTKFQSQENSEIENSTMDSTVIEKEVHSESTNKVRSESTKEFRTEICLQLIDISILIKENSFVAVDDKDVADMVLKSEILDHVGDFSKFCIPEDVSYFEDLFKFAKENEIDLISIDRMESFDTADRTPPNDIISIFAIRPKSF